MVVIFLEVCQSLWLSCWWSRIQTHDPVVGYLVWLLATFLAAQVRTASDRSNQPTDIFLEECQSLWLSAIEIFQLFI